MRNSVLATDFSENAASAASYAGSLSVALQSTLHILNVYHIPNPLQTLPLEIIITPDELKSDTESKLKKLRAELVSQGMDPGHITINTRNGHTVKEISRFADYVHGDLIITGMQGINRIRERLFGSTSYQLIRSTRVPVLAVPSGFEFRKIKKIVFASDGKKITPDSGRILFEIADHFGSTIDIVCIQSPGDYPSDDQVIALLAPVFSRTPHEFHFPGESDVVRGLLAYSDNIKPDLMVIIPGVHTAFFEIMKEHPAKSLMFRSAVPVLALPAGDR